MQDTSNVKRWVHELNTKYYDAKLDIWHVSQNFVNFSGETSETESKQDEGKTAEGPCGGWCFVQDKDVFPSLSLSVFTSVET